MSHEWGKTEIVDEDNFQSGGAKDLEESEISFPLSVLQIQLDTNADGLKLFKRSMIKPPKTSRVPLLTSELPFFTRYVEYPSWIEKAPWQTRYEFFFNRDIFIDTLRKAIKKHPNIWAKKPPSQKKDADKNKSKTEDDLKKENEELKQTRRREIHNVMITLRSIFPIPEIFGNALKNTYQHVLNHNSNGRVFSDVNLKQAINIFGFMYKFGIADKAKEDYFINISGKRYSVEGVVWENDVVNHPEYFKFLEAYHESIEEVEKSRDDVEAKYNGYLDVLNEQLNKMAVVDDIKAGFFKHLISKDSPDAMGFAEFKKNVSDDEKMSIITTKLKSLQPANIIEQLSNVIKANFNDASFNSVAPVVKLIYKNFYCKTANCDDAQWNTIDKYNITKWDTTTTTTTTPPTPGANELQVKWDLDKSAQDAMLKEFVQKIKMENTPYSIMCNLLSNRPSSSDDRNRDRAQVNERMTEKIRRLFGEGREIGDAAAKTIMAIKEDADSYEETKREPISVFINGDYAKYFEDLLRFSVQVNAGSVVYKFATEGVPMILTDKQLDGKEERPIIKRRNKFIRDNFGTEASINNELSNSVKNVFEPVRKTSNAELYKLLKQIKSDIPTNPYATDAELAKIEKERHVFQQIYDRYISTYSSNVQYSDIEPYLYTGVEDAKAEPGKVKDKDTEIQRSVQEIYVRLDLVDADKMKNTPKAPCKYYDKMLENEYLYLTDKRSKDLSRLNKYRGFVFDVPNPLSELAIVAAQDAKNKIEEAASNEAAKTDAKKEADAKKDAANEKKTGGKRHSHKIHRAYKNRTLSTHR